VSSSIRAFVLGRFFVRIREDYRASSVIIKVGVSCCCGNVQGLTLGCPLISPRFSWNRWKYRQVDDD